MKNQPKNKLKPIFIRIKQSKLAKDSFWAVFGNGLGYVMLLFAGIIIARFLEKDLYGEYGVVKTTMLYIAGFATMGLGITSTKYIAEYFKKDQSQLKSLAHDALFITLIGSCIISIILFMFARPLALYLNTPSLIFPFRILGILIVCKAINTTQNGILAGFSNFKIIARNNVICGLFMLIACIPMTYFYGLTGALGALLSSQVINCILNQFSLNKILSKLENQVKISRKKELLLFSIPIALQESTYTISNWGGSLLLVKFSSVGELGIFSAASQWNAIITFVPGLLYNVVLSYLSSNADNKSAHDNTIKKMLSINLACTLIPFAIVYILAGWITSFYGETFDGMKDVLRVYTLCTVFNCCGNVFSSEFIVRHRNWLLMTIRVSRDVLLLISAAIILNICHGENGAMVYASIITVLSALYILLLAVLYHYKLK